MQEIAERKSGKPPESVMGTEEMPDGKDKPVRRARGLASLDTGGANGQRTNGHVIAVVQDDRNGVNGHGTRPGSNGKAASDDASGETVALAANSTAAGTAREACADAAAPPKSRKKKKGAAKAGPRATGESKQVEIPPGLEPLPEDGMTFVDAMHERIDLWEVGKRLMKAGDEKIVQRAWERMLEMKYGKGPTVVGDEVPQIIFDTPRPVRE